jgi:nicotinate-nucleotide adenylyltransferase
MSSSVGTSTGSTRPSGVERVGVFGGTFDPIHVAHLAVGVAAQHQLGLDRVLFVVANVPWQKAQQRRVSAAEDRFTMVDASVRGRAGFEASRLEMDRGGDSFTADTLVALARPDRELYLIIGSDLVGDLTTWRRWEELPAMCTLAVAQRPGAAHTGSLAPGWRTVAVHLPALEISSTELRSMVREGRPIDYLVPSAAVDVIIDKNLYREPTP